MAYLSETPSFDANVYRLDATDPLLGYCDGNNNELNWATQALANRTTYLQAASAQLAVADAAALRNVNRASGYGLAITLGAAATGDGGSGLWRWDAECEAADNVGTVLQPAGHSGAGRWVREYSGAVNVKWFGAAGGGEVNDTVAIQAACDTVNDQGGGTVYFPSGSYRSNKITVYSKTALIGESYGSVEIKLNDNQNTPLIYGAGSDALWGGQSSGGIFNFQLANMVLDGNRANNLTENIHGAVVAIYGHSLRFTRLRVQNGRDAGIWTEFGYGEMVPMVEASNFSDITILNSGRDGWYNGGSHDSIYYCVNIGNSGQNLPNTYSGFYLYGVNNGRFTSCHVWSYSAAVRMGCAITIDNTTGPNQFTNCHFEGAWHANLLLKNAFGNYFSNSCAFYAPWNGINISLVGKCNSNNIQGWVGPVVTEDPQDPLPVPLGDNACVGVYINALTDDDVIENNTFVLDMYLQETTAVTFYVKNPDGEIGGPGTAFQNYFYINDYSLRVPASPSVTGSFHPSNRIIIRGGGNVTKNYDTWNQCHDMVIPANASATWTYNHKFDNTPFIVFSPYSPPGALNDGLWISNISASDVVIFNDNDVQTNVFISARRRDIY